MDDNEELSASILKFRDKYPELSKYLAAKLEDITARGKPEQEMCILKKCFSAMLSNLKLQKTSGK